MFRLSALFLGTNEQFPTYVMNLLLYDVLFRCCNRTCSLFRSQADQQVGVFTFVGSATLTKLRQSAESGEGPSTPQPPVALPPAHSGTLSTAFPERLTLVTEMPL